MKDVLHDLDLVSISNFLIGYFDVASKLALCTCVCECVCMEVRSVTFCVNVLLPVVVSQSLAMCVCYQFA